MQSLELSSKKRLEDYKSPAVDLIAAPYGFGGTDNLAQEGTRSLLEKDMVKKLEVIGVKTNLIEETELGPFEITEESNRIRNIEAILQANEWLCEAVEKSVAGGSIPITLGGDASLSIATVTGLVHALTDKKEKLGILWLSNHMANSSPRVTKSWNANRMAFRVLSFDASKRKKLHEDFMAMQQISKQNPIIYEKQVVHLGVSHKSAQDREEVIHEYYTMEDIQEVGIHAVTKASLDYLLENYDKIQVIWDVNSLDLSGVSNYSPGQLNYREAIYIAREIDLRLRRENKLVAIDIVEHCPSKEAWDKKGQTAYWLTEIIANIFGENIYNCLRKY